MIKKYKEFINEGILDLLSGYSMDEVKEKLKHLTPIERYRQLKKLKLKYEDVYTKEEINNFNGLDKIYASNKYNWVSEFFENRARVGLNGKHGFIDENGNEITPIKYDYIENFINGKAIVELNHKFGLIDINGNIITNIKYDWLYGFINGIAKVELNKKWGAIDKTGKEIIPTKYQYIGDFFDNNATVQLNDKWGHIDINGNEYWD